MKKKKRLLSLLLTFAMCLSLWSVPAFAEEIFYQNEIRTGEMTWVNQENYIFRFVPEKSGDYYLMSTSLDPDMSNPVCRIMCDDGTVFEVDDQKTEGVDQYFGDFCTKQYFEEGKEYYLALYNQESSDGFYFSLKGDNFITHQPTSEEPYVGVINDEKASYQWYQAVSSGAVEITTESAMKMQGGTLTAASSFSEKTGWSPAVSDRTTSDDEKIYTYNCFILRMAAGATMNITLDGGIVGGDGIWLHWIEGNEMIFDSSADSSEGNYEITIESAGTYMLAFESETSGITARAFVQKNSYEIIEGETQNSLKNPEIGMDYYCQVNFGEEDVFQDSDEFTYYDYFTHQPTAAEPYVSGSFSEKEETSYQWYQKKKTDESEVTPETAEEVCGSASYNADNGWSGSDWYNDGIYYYAPFSVSLQAGESMVIETKGSLFGKIILADSDIEEQYYWMNVYEKPDGTYEIEADKDGCYELNFYALTDDVTVKAYIREYEAEEVGAQTAESLTEPVIGNFYWCEVMTEGGSLSSETFCYDYAITHQPVAAEPYVGLNESEDITAQWYTLNLATAEKILPEQVKPAYDFSIGECSYYEEGAGWHGIFCKDYGLYYYDVFELELKAGQSLAIAANGTIANYISLYNLQDGTEIKENATEMENGVYTLTVEEDGLYDLYFYGETKDITLDVWLLDEPVEAVSGADTVTLEAVEADELYFCKMMNEEGKTLYSAWLSTENRLTHQPAQGEAYAGVNDKDSVVAVQWYRGTVSGEEITKSAIIPEFATGAAVYTEENGWSAVWEPLSYCGGTCFGTFCSVNLAEGESITLLVDGTVYGTYGMYAEDVSEVIVAARNEENGVYTLTAEGAGIYYLYAYAKTTDLTMRVYRGAMEYEAADGQDDLRLSDFEEGYYRCEVEFASGKKLTSKTVYLEEKWELGDVNRDGRISAEDALTVLKNVAHMEELDKEQSALADTNRDTRVSAEDALLILKMVAHMISEF